MKMTLTDELKILDDMIKANQAQYDLGWEAAKIFALSSKGLLEKYECLTGQDLGHRPSVLEKTKFEYSPSGMSHHLVNHLKKIMLKLLRTARVVLIMTVTISFLNSTRGMMNLKICHYILSTNG